MAIASESVPPPAHERIYTALRSMLLFGELQPGRDVTLLGLAEQLDVSITPIREAVRRLIAEKALQFHGNRRISVPRMDAARLDELYDVRLLLEPELAMRAVNGDVAGFVGRLEAIDLSLDDAIATGDVGGYLRYNHDFHFTIYRSVESRVFLPIVESLWLQTGPFLRVVCGRCGTASMADHHKSAMEALRNGDAEALRDAIHRDISQGFDVLRGEASSLSEES